jgi:2-phospho-L-lactate guanylyltransferase
MSDATPKPLWGLLPVKDFARAKSRLSPILGPGERAQLSRKLCQHVLHTLDHCAAIDGALVLSDSEEVLRLARSFGRSGELELSAAPRGPLLGAIVDEGLERLASRGVRAALVLMSDLPLLSSDELNTLVSLLHDHDCVLAPDLREQNTNALALRLDRRMPTAFGSGDSFRQHVEKARALGLRTAVHRAPGLGFDVDFPEDYSELPTGADLLRRIC